MADHEHDMQMRNVEERGARCNICARELLVPEIVLYGNRCGMCFVGGFDRTFKGLISYLVLCYYEYQILRCIEKMKYDHRRSIHDPNNLFLGCISEAGGADIVDIRSIKQKRALIKIMRRYLK